MATTLLVVSVVALYFVTRPGIKLALLAAFVTVFGVTVGLLSSCKRSELFAATATWVTMCCSLWRNAESHLDMRLSWLSL